MIFPVAYQIGVQFTTDLLLRLAILGIILIITWIISRILGGFISKALSKLSPRVAQQARRIVTWLTWLIGILIGLSQLGLELTVLLVAVVLGGIIIAIAFRHVLLNLVSYEVIKSYNPFKIGDWIKVGKYYGRVIEITWMDTILMTPDNEIVYVPNSKITQSVVINKTAPGGTRISVTLVVDRALNISELEKILLSIGNELKEELICDSVPEVRITNLNTQSVKLALLLKINNPAKGELIASEIRKRAKERFDEIQRKIPLP